MRLSVQLGLWFAALRENSQFMTEIPPPPSLVKAYQLIRQSALVTLVAQIILKEAERGDVKGEQKVHFLE